MTGTQSARAALRAATRGHHDRVDAIFSQVRSGDRGDYARFLRAQAAAHLPVEAALERDGIVALLPDWPGRRRGDLLRGDLDALGIAPPPPAGEVGFEDEAALLGGAYVLEGSRLGGAMLRRGMPGDWPTAFFAAAPSGAWRTLIDILDARLIRDEDIASACRAAARVFQLFERSGRLFLGPDGVQ